MYIIMTNTAYTETKNNKYLIRQGCHDSGAQSLKKYVKNSKATYANKNNNEDRQTCHVKRYIPSCYFQVHGHEDDVDAVTFADSSSQILISGADDGLCKVCYVPEKEAKLLL